MRMQIFKNPCDVSPCALALGNFDGLHMAHIKIINSCITYSKSNNLKSGVLLFENHTANLCNGDKIPLLTTLSEKLEILKELGIDFVYIMTFDESVMKMSAKEFFEFLVKCLNAKALFAGYDYTFGYKAMGNSDLLTEFSKEKNIYVDISDKITLNNTPVSSTKIREFLKTGNIKKSNEFLGRPYSLTGNVVLGKQNGRKMGLPTANINADNDKLLPQDGVYKGITIIDKKEYKSLINIGKNPTFNADKRTVESHILNFSADIYNKEITIKFLDKIRDEKKFLSVEELIIQINEDLKKI